MCSYATPFPVEILFGNHQTSNNPVLPELAWYCAIWPPNHTKYSLFSGYVVLSYQFKIIQNQYCLFPMRIILRLSSLQIQESAVNCIFNAVDYNLFHNVLFQIYTFFMAVLQADSSHERIQKRTFRILLVLTTFDMFFLVTSAVIFCTSFIYKDPPFNSIVPAPQSIDIEDTAWVRSRFMVFLKGCFCQKEKSMMTFLSHTQNIKTEVKIIE